MRGACVLSTLRTAEQLRHPTLGVRCAGEINWAEFVKMMSMAMNAVNDMAHLVAMDPTEGGATGHVS